MDDLRRNYDYELLAQTLAAKVGKLANLGRKTAAGKNILILETAYFLKGF